MGEKKFSNLTFKGQQPGFAGMASFLSRHFRGKFNVIIMRNQIHTVETAMYWTRTLELHVFIWAACIDEEVIELDIPGHIHTERPFNTVLIPPLHLYTVSTYNHTIWCHPQENGLTMESGSSPGFSLTLSQGIFPCRYLACWLGTWIYIWISCKAAFVTISISKIAILIEFDCSEWIKKKKLLGLGFQDEMKRGLNYTGNTKGRLSNTIFLWIMRQTIT